MLKIKKQRMLLILWVIVALLAVISGGLVFWEKYTEKIEDISVSGTGITCTGGCLYFGVQQYAVGTACRGVKPGDPNYTGTVDYSDKCYVCGADGNFTNQALSACNKCYAQCLGDPSPTQYSHGDKCAAGTGADYGIFTCNMGVWAKDSSPSKCAGSCSGDGPYTLYNKDHLCFAENACWKCVEPGREFQGGFDQVDVAQCDSVRPTGESCRGQCQFDTAQRDYNDGSECQSGAGTSQYGTYRCNNGTWEKSAVQKCVGQAPGDRPGTLYQNNFAFEWVGKCFQCTTPGREFQGGFDEVDMAICAAQVGNTQRPHAKAGACLGDLDGSGVVELNDFANFARLFNQQLGDFWYYDIVNSDVAGVLNLNDFSVFGRNFGKHTSNCEKREVELTMPTL